MTYSNPAFAPAAGKRGPFTWVPAIKAAKTQAVVFSAALLMSAPSAMASDITAPQNANAFKVSSAADGNIRASAKAFKRGRYDRAAMFSRAAIKSGLNGKREAIAQSNLCAAYAALGQYEDAAEACDKALALRGDYAPAQINREALTVRLAKNMTAP